MVRGLEGRLSIWPADQSVPAGWTATGTSGTRAECLDHIEASGWPFLLSHRQGAEPSTPASDGDTLLRRWRSTVEQHRYRPAVTNQGRSMTYGEMDQASDDVARRLLERGLDREDRVAVLLPRGIELIAVLLGILKAGGAYVPVDTRYPDMRQAQMTSGSGARIAIADRQLPDLDMEVLTAEQLLRPGAPAGELPAVTDEQAACVLFTSGSSGRPKPILLEHRNLCYFAGNRSLPELTSSDRVAQVSSVSFDAFNFEVWCSVFAGAEIVILPAMPDLIGNDIQRELRRQRITAMLAPTMAVNHLVREDRDAFSSLRILCTGGDVILPTACRQLLDGAFKGAFYNLYGPTEGTTACTGYRIDLGDVASDTVPIGSALDGAAVYVLNESLAPVADGETGELYIGGAGVARGYLGMLRMTADRFLPDPFVGEPGLMYATGDLGRRRRDGNLEFLGRTDDQVKVRGYRVEPGEVERALLRHEHVQAAAVVPVGSGDGVHLVALVVPEGGLPLDALRRHAADVMPDYMVPSALVAITEIPITDHGKRDLPALRHIAQEEMRRRDTLIPPRDEAERYLAGVWKDLLSVEEVGAADDFFALGGNSLLTFRVRQRIKRDHEVTIPMKDILTVTVLSEQAAILRDQKRPAAR
ncbi:amino acid adenylation domain-containing protein [Micromonospora sp. WMMA1976]|uniref:amino acid adenylation domain-containing protein n=1 Tax=Micromonospora sp. WMMA1976 TaxID=3014995 RepID=UPI00248BA9AD|nr:amino acid adenylation domain-containing protein [Micromonospora sp. WMMA1976]WBC01113.1 amino acid adenylation domain-containing protein [Micromonospora sp. WMMA1976]